MPTLFVALLTGQHAIIACIPISKLKATETTLNVVLAVRAMRKNSSMSVRFRTFLCSIEQHAEHSPLKPDP
jgi:hypothetical protein